MGPFSPENESRWHSVANREKSADGAFVYGVVTTHIYCRPSCASRQPKPENVVFFDVPAAAEIAGFRACKRCHPRQAVIEDGRLQLVQKICDYLHTHLEDADKLTLAELGATFHYDPQTIQKTFKEILEMTPRQYAEKLRLDHLKDYLRTADNVTSAIYAAGFSSPSRVYEHAAETLGMTPADYRQLGQGITIGYTIVDCYLGALLVGMTPRGVCAVGIYDDSEQAETALLEEYPHAAIYRDDENLRAVVQSILAHVDGQRPTLDLPLDIQATAFQWKVWQALRRIPHGETRSYADIAAAIEQPTAVRAVANACAHNVAAIVIPCHRVIGKDGALHGYRWGSQRKQALLARESVAASGQDSR